MPLNFNSLKKAIESLERSIVVVDTHLTTFDAATQETLRAGVIQNFEVAYEQCWKMIQRWLKDNITPEEADNPRTRKDLFRLAAKYQLIDDPLPWFTYGEARNLTSHMYDEEKALSVFNTAKAFLTDAQQVLKQLELLND